MSTGNFDSLRDRVKRYRREMQDYTQVRQLGPSSTVGIANAKQVMLSQYVKLTVQRVTIVEHMI